MRHRDSWTLLSPEKKDWRKRVIDQGGGVEINLREWAGWTEYPLSTQQFPPRPFVKHRAAIFSDYFQGTSLFLNQKSIWISSQICQVLDSLSAFHVLKLPMLRKRRPKKKKKKKHALEPQLLSLRWKASLSDGLTCHRNQGPGEETEMPGMWWHWAPQSPLLTQSIFLTASCFWGDRAEFTSTARFPVTFQLYPGSNHSVSRVSISGGLVVVSERKTKGAWWERLKDVKRKRHGVYV